MALASVGAPALRLPPPGHKAVTDLGILVAELLLVALLSPEAGEALMRLGFSEPCEVREMPGKRALAALHRSRIWRQHARLVSGDAPLDMWRELCWWLAVYPAEGSGHPHTSEGGAAVVFAVQVKSRQPAIRAAVAPPPASPPGSARRVGDTGSREPVLPLSKNL